MKPFASIQPPDGMCCCHDCGYQWQRGNNRVHSCVEHLQKLIQDPVKVADLKKKVELATELLLPLAKIAIRWRGDGMDETRPYWGDTEEVASGVAIVSGRGGADLLFMKDCFRAESFYKQLGIDLSPYKY